MLINKDMFDSIERFLIENGTMAKFEAENGEIKGRIMITQADIPNGIEVRSVDGKIPYTFEASFDFYDSTVGIAIYSDVKMAASGIWITPQKEGAEAPAQEWIEFFVEKLMKSIEDDGSFGVPIYSFVNDTCDMTIIPTKPDIDNSYI